MERLRKAGCGRSRVRRTLRSERPEESANRDLRTVWKVPQSFSTLGRLLGFGRTCGCGRYRSRDTAKAQVISACTYLALTARSYHVARAVLIGAKKRPSAVDLFPLRGLGGVKGSVRSFRIASRSPRAGQLRVVGRSIPVRGPLPDISCHVVQTVPVGRVLRHRGQSREAVGT